MKAKHEIPIRTDLPAVIPIENVVARSADRAVRKAEKIVYVVTRVQATRFVDEERCVMEVTTTSITPAINPRQLHVSFFRLANIETTNAVNNSNNPTIKKHRTGFSSLATSE